LKDNDFIKQGIKIKIGADAKEKLLETLKNDVDVRKCDSQHWKK
jgi:hypothetical protein